MSKDLKRALRIDTSVREGRGLYPQITFDEMSEYLRGNGYTPVAIPQIYVSYMETRRLVNETIINDLALNRRRSS